MALDVPLYPLEVQSPHKVFGVMLKAGYGPLPSNLSAARVHVTELGCTLQDDLRLWMRGVSRAMNRDQGRTRRAVVFNLVAVSAGAPLRKDTCSSSGPGLSWTSLLISVWWMLREMETLELIVSSVSARPSELKAELRLGRTKTDVHGTGCRRVFDRTCRTALPRDLCPHHALEKAVGARLGAGALPGDPLFATTNERRASAEGTINAWRAAAPLHLLEDDFLGGGIKPREPSWGHTPRRVGVQCVAARGMKLWQVACGRLGAEAAAPGAASLLRDAAEEWGKCSETAAVPSRRLSRATGRGTLSVAEGCGGRRESDW